MPEKISPFVESKYGWEYGESGWNTGVDENFVKFGFLHDSNIDAIVNNLPTAVNGKAYYLTSDKRLYFVVNNTYYSTPIPKWFKITLRETGEVWHFDGNSLVPSPSISTIDSRLDAVESITSTLGTAAFEDVGDFATAEELNLVKYTTIRPEDFQPVGTVGVGNAIADTEAWRLACLALTDGGKLQATGNYLINGSNVVIPPRNNITLDLRGSTLTQQNNFSKTIQINNPTGLTIIGGRFFGRGGAAGEYNGASSSYNGVAAIFVNGGSGVMIDGVVGRQHAGGCIVLMGVVDKTVKNCNIQGIGYPYIDPVGQGNQGNGSDFGIMCQPTDNSLGWIYEDRFENNRIWDTAFGIQSVQTRTCKLKNNDIGPILGQHGFYGIENDGLDAQGNSFYKCYQGGIKTQFENYSGFNIGPMWVSGTSYTPGQKVRFSSVLWICQVANSDTVFTSSKWLVDPLTFRKGTVIQGNTFEANGYDILVVSTTQSDGREIYNYGASIKHNVSRGCINASMSLDRCVQADVSNNDIDTCVYGIFGRDFSGRIANNVIKAASKNAVATSLYDTVTLDNNDFINAGLSGTGDDSRAVVLVYAPTASGIPSQSANPTVYYINNAHRFPTGDALGNYLVFNADTRNRWHIEGTRGTTTTKKFRIDGGNSAVIYQFRNNFAQNGYLNTAQNEVTYTPTIASTLRTFDSSTVTLPNLANVVGTMLNDQKVKFTVK